MKDRIIEFMNYLQMKPSTFANATNIKLATLSQILNGRNNPSLEVVTKIRTAFPFLSYDWMLSGEGEMCKEQPTLPFEENIPSKTDENPLFPTERTDGAENRKDFAPYQPQEHPKASEIEEIRYIEKPAKKIREIKIFFDDDTYETFVPQK